MSGVGTRPGRSVGAWLLHASSGLTTPLVPEDFLGLINPLWSRREPRGRVVDVSRELDDTTTLVIRPGVRWRPHRPGQYVGIGVQIRGVWHWRTYSLTSAPGLGDGLLSITVRAMPDGTVSRHLAHRVGPGAVLRLGPAAGEFVLPTPVPERLLFVTAGSGITPVMGILRDLVLTGGRPDTVLVHSARTPDDVIFGGELRKLARQAGWLRLVERHTALAGRLRTDDLTAACPDWARRETFACGPAGLLDALTEHWRTAGLATALRVERFRPPRPAVVASGGRVRFTASGIDAHADGATPLLLAGESAGGLLPHGCRMGICHTCVGALRRGAVRDLHTGELHDTEGELVRTCVSAAAGDVEIEL